MQKYIYCINLRKRKIRRKEMNNVMRVISEKDLQIIALIGVCYQHLFLISTIKKKTNKKS